MLTCSAFSSFAQANHPFKGMPAKEKWMHIVDKQQRSAAKTTATYWRLSASADYSRNGISLELSDSTEYKYSAGRGSVISNSDMYVNDYGLNSSVDYDTANKYRDIGNGFELSTIYVGVYNNNNKREQSLELYDNGQGFQNSYGMFAEFDTKGNIIAEYQAYWDNMAGAWDTGSVTIHTYNAQNKVLLDSTAYTMGGISSKTVYEYDGNGNLKQSIEYDWNGASWDPSYRSTYTYTSGNLLKTHIDASFDMTTMAWEDMSFDSTGYNSAGVYNYYIYREWDPITMIWVNSYLETRVVNSKGQPTETKYSEWDDNNNIWSILYDANFTYNTNNDPEKMTGYMYLGGIKVPAPAYVRNYYYEPYFKASVSDINSTLSVSVYPNPAVSDVNIISKGAAISKVSLTSISGNTVRSLSVDSEKASLPVSGLAAGNYIITVESKGNAPYRQMVSVQ